MTFSAEMLKKEVARYTSASHWRRPHLPNIEVLAMTDGLFGPYGWERRDELLIGIPPPPPHVPNMPCVASVDVKHHDKEGGGGSNNEVHKKM